jgi:branched-chain amino acid transport system substrate-binding protein
MHLNRVRATAALFLALAVTVAGCSGMARGGGGEAGSESPGISEDEIVLGLSLAQSGPLSVYGNFAEAMDAYFQYVNEEQGGIDGRKIRLITYDDAFEPSRTLENVRRLADQDQVFAITGVVGT